MLDFAKTKNFWYMNQIHEGFQEVFGKGMKQ